MSHEEIQKRILDAMEPNRAYARAELAGPLDISASGWKKAMTALIDAGLVLRSGLRRGTRYTLAPPPEEAPEDEASPPDAPPPAAPTSRTGKRSARSKNADSLIERILDFMSPGTRYSRKDITEPLDITVSVWNRIITQLVDEGHVLREGKKRGTRYVLAREPEAPEAASPRPTAAAQPSRSRPKPVRRRPTSPRPAPAPSGPPGRGRFDVDEAELRALLEIPKDAPLIPMLAHHDATPDLWRHVSALANASGGFIALGVKQRHHGLFTLKGLHAPDRLTSSILGEVKKPEVISRRILTGRNLRRYEHKRRKLLVVRIPELDAAVKPIYVGETSYHKKRNLGTFIYTDNKVRKATEDEITDMWRAAVAPHTLVTLDKPNDLERLDRVVHTARPVRDPTQNSELRDLAEPSRQDPRLSPTRIRELILALCGERPLTPEQLALLLDRRVTLLNNRFLKPLVKEGKLHQDGSFLKA